MPTITGTDLFDHGNFTVPGGGPYTEVGGTPAKDLTIVRAGDPASLLISAAAAAEFLGSAVPSPPTRGWCGFAWRMNAADEPAGNVDVQTFWGAGFAVNSFILYLPATNELLHSAQGAVAQVVSVTLDAWHWIEHIWDVTASPHASYMRVDGVDVTPSSAANAATTVNFDYIGYGAAATHTQRFSRHMWGTAASVTDWLGDPFSTPRFDTSKFPKPKLRSVVPVRW